MLGQQNAFFAKTAFWRWIGNTFYHSLIAFVFSIIIFWGDLKQANGLDSELWFWGTQMYFTVLLTVLGKAALISDLWTKYTVADIPGSFAFSMLFLPLYATVAPAIGFSTEYDGIVPRLWTDWVFYFTLFLVPLVCSSRDFCWKYQRFITLPKNSRSITYLIIDHGKNSSRRLSRKSELSNNCVGMEVSPSARRKAVTCRTRLA